MRRTTLRALTACCLLPLAACGRDPMAAVPGPAFQATLGPRSNLPKGNALAEAYAVNNDGIAVGYTSSAVDATHTGARWNANANGLLELGTPGDVVGASYAFGINDDGLVVGSWYADDDPAQAYRPWKWTSGMAAPVELALLSVLANAQGEARDVNTAGIAVGWATNASQVVRAVQWDLGLGTITDVTPAGTTTGQALAINKYGQMAGWAQYPAGIHAVRWAGSPADLGTLGGVESRALDVNRDGWVVGWSYTGTGERRGFLWRDAGEGLVELPLLPGALTSTANTINDRGDIGGWMDYGIGARPVVWERGSLTPIDLEPANAGFHGEVFGINNRGRAVGTDYTLSGYNAVRWEVLIANAPVAVLTAPATAAEGVNVRLRGESSADVDDQPLTYDWDFGDGATAAGMNVWHAWADDGVYEVELVVTDPSGLADTATTSITITNQAPVPTLTITAPGTTLYSGATLQVEVAYTDPDALASSSLTWGDGTSATGLPTTPATPVALAHTYVQPGTYNVRYTVTDDQAATRRVTRQITVVRLPVAVDVTPVTLTGAPGELVTVILFGAPGVDVTLASNLKLGDGVGAETSPVTSSPTVLHANGDGIPDLRVRFRVSDLTANGDFTTNSADLILKGNLPGGVRFISQP